MVGAAISCAKNCALRGDEGDYLCHYTIDFMVLLSALLLLKTQQSIIHGFVVGCASSLWLHT